MATLLSIRTRIRLITRDTESGNYRLADSVINEYINSAVRRINHETHFNEKTGSIAPDGTNSSFTLLTSMTDYLSARTFYYANGRVLKMVDISDIRELYSIGAIIVGDPNRYAIFGGKVYFDSIPVSGNTIYTDYCAIPTDMTLDAHTPPAPLHQFDAFIVAGTMLELCGDLGYEDMNPRFTENYNVGKIGFTRFIELGGKHQVEDSPSYINRF